MVGVNLFAYCFNNPVNYFDPTGEIAVTTVILIVSIVVGVAVAGYTAYVEYEAGCDTVQIIGDSICNGLAAFNIVYTAGMSLYQLYQNFCYLHGLTPVTEISFSNNAQTAPPIPQTAIDTLSHVDKKGCPPPNYKGGSVFQNDGRHGSQILPSSGAPYYKYDIHPHVKGVDRGVERLVVGSDNSAWYTNDHYKTFVKIRDGIYI